MDSFEVNKILGAVLGTVFVLFGGSLVAEAIFHSEVPETFGYAVEVSEESGGAAPAAEEAAAPIAVLLADADADAGASQFKKCQACHDGTKGGANKVGPHLWDVVMRPVASIEDFNYSAAMKDFSNGGQEQWTYDHLNHFLTSPKDFIPGTAMGFAGIKKDQDRANLIAYLRTLNDNPPPLPEPEAAEEQTAQDAAATEETNPATTTEPAAEAGTQPQGGGTAPAASDAEGEAASPAEEATPADQNDAGNATATEQPAQAEQPVIPAENQEEAAPAESGTAQ
ncbi:c-type cytochrome [Consotaella aegiceratis]|uniref:c-type cytochrome n=1 Tax=Consotaella aegiceratis TaxID=3097961 RepID=UPI002F4165A1